MLLVSFFGFSGVIFDIVGVIPYFRDKFGGLMSRLNPESLAWLDQVKTLQTELNNASRDEIQKALNLSTSHVTNLLRLKACFDANALEKVRMAASPAGILSPSGTQQAFILSFKSALALTGLKKLKTADLSPTGGLFAVIHAALDFILSHRLTTGQIKALVEWLKAGKPITAFDPKRAVSKTKTSSQNTESEETPEDEEEKDSLTWKEMYDHAKKTNGVGSFFTGMLIAFSILGGFLWLAWKLIGWLIHLL